MKNPMSLSMAARNLIWLHEMRPDLFDHVLPIDAETMRTLTEIAEFDEEESPNAAE